MTSPSFNADVWVIDHGQAILFRQRDQQWNEEQRLPFEEFSGSAVALASFGLPETRVYLNLQEIDDTEAQMTQQWWAGVGLDPARIVHAQANHFQNKVLTELKSMGKSAQVISAKNPRQFGTGVPMSLLNTQEIKHLRDYANTVKSGLSAFASNMRLYSKLWLLPVNHYQSMRFVAVTCVLIAFFSMHWHNEKLLSSHEKNILQKLQTTLNSTSNNPIENLAFMDWIEQIRKFGQGERANLKSLKVSWDEQGKTNTRVDLERDRKRAPKACQLTNPDRAECSTGGTLP